MPCYRGEFVQSHPRFSETSTALCKGEIQPVSVDTPDIDYTEEDEKAIDQYTREYGRYSVLRILSLREKLPQIIR